MRRLIAPVMALLGATAMASGDTAASRSFECTYRVAVESIRASADSVKVWVPVPQTTEHQTVTNVRVVGTPNHRFVVDDPFGNKFVLVDVRPGVTHASFDVAFDVTRQRRHFADAPQAAPALENRSLYLTPTSLVAIDGPIADEARRVAGTAEDPLLVARKLYDHIVNTMRYDRTGEGWGRGDALYACDVRRGNCTDFHSLFMGEAIALGVPVRFLMGFSVPTDAPEGSIAGYHCWAEFYVDGRGWIPVDASEAFKDPSRRDELFGGLDPHRVQFTMGRDLALPEMQGPPLNYSIYPYVEVDGKPHGTVRWRVLYRDLE